MIAWFTRNDVAANLLMLTLLLVGLFSLKSQIPLEVFPSFETDRISVSVSLRGATPEDVEQGVTIRIEESVKIRGLGKTKCFITPPYLPVCYKLLPQLTAGLRF